MTTITNQTGTKSVRICRDASGTFHAIYVQVCTEPDGQVDEQVLEAKSYATLAGARRWATRQLA